MSIGTSILNLMGVQDPRQQLLARIASATAPVASAPYAGTQPQPDPSTTPEVQQAQQRTPPQPEALTSPDDLKQMYSDLLKYNDRAQGIDRGIGLLGAAFAQPDNRANVMNMFAGQDDGMSNYTDPAKMAGLSLELNKAAVGRAQYAAQMASLPALAQKYGIDLPTAQMLLQSGKLDDFVSEREKQQFEIKNRPHTYLDNNGQINDIDPNAGTATVIGGEKKPNNAVVEGPGGQKDVVDMNTGDVLKNLFGPDESKYKKVISGPGNAQFVMDTRTNEIKPLINGDTRTPNQKDYALYEEQYRSNDLTGTAQPPHLSFDQFLVEKRGKGVTVNTGDNSDAGTKAFQKTLGENEAKHYTALQDAATAGQGNRGMYDIAEKALNTGMKTGFGADAQNTLAHLYYAMGGDADVSKMTATDVFKSVQNQLALIKRNPAAGLGMPGSLSDKDIQFLKDSDINLGATPDANHTMIEIARRIDQRKVDLANLASDYITQRDKDGKLVHPTLDAGFDKQLRQFADDHSLFGDLQIAPQSLEQRRKAAFEKYGITGQ